MSIFQRPHYKSEVTQFIEHLKKERPYLDQQQQQGRALLWDKNVNPRIWREYRAAEVPAKPYPYQPESAQESSAEPN